MPSIWAGLQLLIKDGDLGWLEGDFDLLALSDMTPRPPAQVPGPAGRQRV